MCRCDCHQLNSIEVTYPTGQTTRPVEGSITTILAGEDAAVPVQTTRPVEGSITTTFPGISTDPFC
jgi:hypothetical protein